MAVQPPRQASFLSALDAVLDRVEGFLVGFVSEEPADLRKALHEARIRHMTAHGIPGQAVM